MKLIHVISYSLVALASARVFYVVAFKTDYEHSVKKDFGPEEKRLHYAKRFGLYFAWMGLIWPIAWPAFCIVWFVTRPTGLEKDIERRKAEERAAAEHKVRVDEDMVRLRKHFKAVDMDAPDTTTLRKIAEDRVNKNEDIDD